MDFFRPLIPVICAYTAGVWLVHEIYHVHPIVAVVIGVFVMAAAGWLAFRQRELSPLYLTAIAMLGAAVMISYDIRASRASEILKAVEGPELKYVAGEVVAISELADTEYSRIVLQDVTVTSGSVRFAFPGKVQLAYRRGLSRDSDIFVSGERIQFAGQIGPPGALQNFFGYNRLENLRHDEIYGAARPVSIPGSVQRIDPEISLRGRISLGLIEIRRQVAEDLDRVMGARESRFMSAMLFNDMRRLTDEEKEIFRMSGTYHLFAVSGMHVAILGLILHIVFRGLRLRVRASWLAVAVCLFMYLWLIGFVPSATRSYLMLVAFTMGYMLGREVDSLTSLVFSIAVALFYDPLIWWNAGFMLSVAGVAAIVIFVPRMKLWLGVGDRQDCRGVIATLKYFAIEAGIVTLAISIFMLPLQLYYFGYWNLLSPVANMLQAFISTAVLGAGVLCAVLVQFSEQAGEWAGQGATVIMAVIYGISRLTAEARGAVFYVSQVPLIVMLLSYSVILSGYYMTTQRSPAYLLKSRARFVTHTVCGFGILFGFNLVEQVRPHGLEIYGFDVGQGDSTLIRFPDNRTMLIDGGVGDPDMGRLVILPQLRGLGIGHLDFLVATHDDGDHTGGLASVVKEIPVRKLLVPYGFDPKSQSARALMRAAEDRFVDVRQAGDGMETEADGCQVEFLNPAEDEFTSSTDNDRSLVVQVTHGAFGAMFTGDAGTVVESRLIAEGKAKPVTLLKAGHHGSRTSSGKDFLEALRPEMALISCGANNNFGHPHGAVLDNLMRLGAKVYRTDRMGAFYLQTDGVSVRIKTAGH